MLLALYHSISFRKKLENHLLLNRYSCNVVEMAKKNNVKITVLKKLNPSEVFNKSPVTPINPLTACELYEDGQEFIVNEDLERPNDLCAWAWYPMYPLVATLIYGGNFPWYKEKDVAISCCADGLRPVIFKLERI